VHLYFFALTPPEPLRGQIEAFRMRWGSPHHKVEPHITVKAPFTWQEDPAVFIAAVQASLTEIAPFPVQLGDTGRFGGAVLYLTVSGPKLLDLHLRVVGAMEPWAPADRRGHEGGSYTPHMTLAAARFGIDAARLAAMQAEAQAELTELPPFAATALRLYEKRPSDKAWQFLRDLPLGSVV
jgi:2'-5' RNA ligase